MRCVAANEKNLKKENLTFTEAAAMVVKHAKEPSMTCAPCTDGNVYSDTGGFVAVSEDLKNFYTLNSEGVVESWNGPLVVYDMTGWRKSKGGSLCPDHNVQVRE